MNIPNAPPSSLPPLRVVAGPARSGKTRWCLNRLREGPGDTWLVADAGGERVRARAESAGIPEDTSQGRILDSGKLLDLLDLPDHQRRRRMGHTLQRILMEEAIAAAVSPGGPFHRASCMDGFVVALRSIIRELKLCRATPAALAASASKAADALGDPDFGRKATELARIWAEYEAILARHGCRDDEDRVADAALSVASGRPRIPKALLVDGRRRIEPLWQEVLAAVAARGCEVTVTFPHDASRPLLFGSTVRAVADLRHRFEVTIEPLVARADRPLAPALAHLERGLFGDTPRMALPDLASSPIALFDAPSPYAEAEMVARELLARHAQGTPWRRCAVIVRSAAVQAPVIAAVLRHRFDVPAVVRLQLPVGEHPAVQTLLALLEVLVHDWRRADLARYLKSTYAPIDRLAADLFVRRLRVARVADGREALLAQLAAKPVANVALREHIETMLDWSELSAVADRPPGAVAADIQGMLAAAIRIKEPDPDARVALKAVEGVLMQVAEAAELRREGSLSFAELARRLAVQCMAARYHTSTPKPGQDVVEVMEPDEAHGLDAESCAVMGMTERVFPKRAAEDPFLRDDEREALAATDGPRLPLRRHEADDERLRFYLAATTPTERLVLSFARATEEQDALPSFYLDDVRALYDHVPAQVATLAEVVPDRARAATAHEVLLAECAEAVRGGGTTPAVADALAALDARSLPPAPRIGDPDRRAKAASHRRFGMSPLESYLLCPFRHYARQVLRLREETAGAGPTDRGSIYHRVLQRTMRRLHGTAPNVDVLRAALREDLDCVLSEHRVDAPPHRTQMMERALREALDGFAAREVRSRGVVGAVPTYYELGFGQDPTDDAHDEDDGSIDSPGPREHDPASTHAPLVVPAGEAGQPVEVSGTIDRVDLFASGRSLVMDYKLGRGVKFDEMQTGASLQMPVYMLAIERLWNHPAAVASYDSARENGRPRVFRRTAVDNPEALRPIPGVEHGHAVKPMNEEEYARLLQTAEDSVRRAAAGLRASNIVPRPGKHCDTCAFSDLCRTNTAREHDGEELPAP